MLGNLRAIIFAGLLLAFAAPGRAAPAMFGASFIFHAWGNDISSGVYSPYSTNDWTALPLGYDCQHHTWPYSTNGPPGYCKPTQKRRGHPATGAWTRSIGTWAPPRITMQQSDFGVALTLHERGFLPTFPPYLQTFTYATFVNAAGSFFAGGGAAANAYGYNNKTGMGSGTWRIRAGKNAFGGAMGLLGKFGAVGKYTVPGRVGTYHGTSSWNMIKVLGRPLYGCSIMPCLYYNPYSKTDMWYNTTPTGGKVKVHTILAIDSGTLWTTGQVGNFAKAGAYYTSLYRTGYDNRTPGGRGSIQLVTPTLTHWLSSDGYNTHTAQIGILTIQVPEPGIVLLLAAGVCALVGLRLACRRR